MKGLLTTIWTTKTATAPPTTTIRFPLQTLRLVVQTVQLVVMECETLNNDDLSASISGLGSFLNQNSRGKDTDLAETTVCTYTAAIVVSSLLHL
jgi:hypothetical protein